MYALAGLEEPPIHFPLGRDAIFGLKARNKNSDVEIRKYESWSDVLPKL